MKSTLFTRPDQIACIDCPYRRDAPSGLWSAEEYDKLPLYDREFPVQPRAAFGCHKQTGALCAGWVGCHGADNLLALRFLPIFRAISPIEWTATMDFKPDPRVPLFSSGKEAAEHGKRNIDHPDHKTVQRAVKLIEGPAPLKRRTYG